MKKNNIYDWPHYYDWTSDGLEYDISYYTDLAKRFGGPVLELGCGTGRVSLAIAREGFDVVGVDTSRSMLDQAKAKSQQMGLNSRIQWFEADMKKFSCSQQFPLIIIPYRSFLHIPSVREQMDVLHQVHHHLTEDGCLAFNVFVPHIMDLVSMEGVHHYRGVFPVPGTEEEIEVYDTTEYDHFHQMAYVTRYYERFSAAGQSLERVKTEMKIRYLFPVECSHLLSLCGFQIHARYGTFAKECFHSESKELIVEAGKRTRQNHQEHKNV